MNELTVLKLADGDWLVVAVKTHLDRPKVGTILTPPDLHVMNQANTWIIHREKQ